ncbi:MAG: type II toxin-antitoxin system RelB/DinJ family antitoxin [Candidatus Paceibacterota bacterium]|jgi:addiction module RelB/DinJ family antitoxin
MTTNTKTLITVKTDKDLKLAAQETAKEIGISLGTLINSFLKQFVRNKEVNFSVSYKPTAYLKAAIAEAEKEYAEGNFKTAHSVEELMEELRS